MRANRPAILALIFLLVTALPARCDDGSEDWWSDPWESISDWFYENLYKPVSDAVQGVGEWLYENVYEPASEWWYVSIQRPIEDWWGSLGNTVSEAWDSAGEWWYQNVQQSMEYWWSDETWQWVDQTVENTDRYFSGMPAEDVVEVGEEAHPTGETGLDGVNDIWDVDFPTLWLGWDITFPWGQKWTVGIDLMAPFEATFNKGAEVAFEVFFKKPVGLMWSVWSGTYKMCRGLGLAAPFAVTAAAGVEVSVGVVLVMILQKVIDVIL